MYSKRGKGQNYTGAKAGPATILGANPEERIRYEKALKIRLIFYINILIMNRQLKEEVARHEAQLRERQQERDSKDRARQDLYQKKTSMNV